MTTQENSNEHCFPLTRETYIKCGEGCKKPGLGDPQHDPSANECGDCASGDIKKLNDMLKKMLNDDEYWQKLSTNTHNYVQENHNPIKNVPVLKMHLNKLINNKAL